MLGWCCFRAAANISLVSPVSKHSMLCRGHRGRRVCGHGVTDPDGVGQGALTFKAPRKYGGYFRKESDHRDFVSIGTAAGAAALLCLLLLTCPEAPPGLKNTLPMSVDILPLK